MLINAWTPGGRSVRVIEAQVERFAPGFRERFLARHVMTPADFEAYNPNYVGGACKTCRSSLPGRC